MDVNGVTLHVRDTGGDGPAVILLHGWPDTGDLWRHQVPALEAAGYRVIAPDLRGYGQSSKPTDLDAYRPTQLLGDVTGILDALDLPRAHVVGHDWGAFLAWITAMLAPDRVASLTVMSVGHPGAIRAAGLPQREKSWYMLLFQFPGVAEQWLSADDFRNFRQWAGHPDADEVVGRMSDPAALTASLSWYRAIVPPESLVGVPGQLPPVTVPTMGIWSSEDIALLEAGMTGSAQYVAGPWQYERLDGIGHWMQLEAPDAVNTLLLDFLTKQP
jgi:pimeloyl-ACP methyl ester carboxylesterase